MTKSSFTNDPCELQKKTQKSTHPITKQLSVCTASCRQARSWHKLDHLLERTGNGPMSMSFGQGEILSAYKNSIFLLTDNYENL